jgi:hypothetical protein
MKSMSMVYHHTTFWLLGTLLVGLTTSSCNPASSRADDEPAVGPQLIVDFERHVAPLFGRLGCNAAACHGAFSGGRGGLQLSLFGHSPKLDYRAVVDRVDCSDPESSLLLLKPSGLEQHEGGVRFTSNSDSYRTIHRWIQQGAPWNEGSGRVTSLLVDPPQLVFDQSSADSRPAPQSLAVTAEFADGTRQLVTHLCQFTSRDEGTWI